MPPRRHAFRLCDCMDGRATYPTALRPPGFIKPCLPTHASVAPSGF
jgi:hypothetical protein